MLNLLGPWKWKDRSCDKEHSGMLQSPPFQSVAAGWAKLHGAGCANPALGSTGWQAPAAQPALQSSAHQQGISLAATPAVSRKARAPQGKTRLVSFLCISTETLALSRNSYWPCHLLRVPVFCCHCHTSLLSPWWTPLTHLSQKICTEIVIRLIPFTCGCIDEHLNNWKGDWSRVSFQMWDVILL